MRSNAQKQEELEHAQSKTPRENARASEVEAAEWYSMLTAEDRNDLSRVMTEQAVNGRLDRVLYLGKRMESEAEGKRAQKEEGNTGTNW